MWFHPSRQARTRLFALCIYLFWAGPAFLFQHRTTWLTNASLELVNPSLVETNRNSEVSTPNFSHTAYIATILHHLWLQQWIKWRNHHQRTLWQRIRSWRHYRFITSPWEIKNTRITGVGTITDVTVNDVTSVFREGSLWLAETVRQCLDICHSSIVDLRNHHLSR